MKWINPNDKEPAFQKRYLLLGELGNWQPGYLKEIKTTSDGTIYIWQDDDGDTPEEAVTHYMKIEPPKE